MKRLLPLLLTAAVAFTACAAAPESEVPLATPTPEPTATAAPATENGEFYAIKSIDPALNTGDAYYELRQQLNGCLLLKTDYATATQSICCTVPGCAHDSDACPAYFPGRASRYRIVADAPLRVQHVPFSETTQTWEEYYKENVAPALEHREDWNRDLTDEEILAYGKAMWAEKCLPSCLFTIDPAAGKTQQDLPEESGSYAFTMCDGTALYGVQNTGMVGQYTTGCRLDLATGEMQPVPLEPNEQFLEPYDGALLTYRYVTDAPLPDDWEQYAAAKQSATLEFDYYDPRTGARRMVAQRPYNAAEETFSGFTGTHNGKLYFEERESLQDAGYRRLGLTAVDPDGTQETVWDTWYRDDIWMPFQYNDFWILPAHGDRTEPWIWLEGSDGVTGSSRCALLNAATGEVVPVEQKITDEPGNFNVRVEAQTADGRWLVWTESDSTGACTGMGLIAPDDFAAGSTDWQPITMWEG